MPPERIASGVSFDPRSHPAAAALTAAGLPVLDGREAVAATIAPVTGPDAQAMRQATGRAERAARLLAASGPQALERAGLVAVRTAIGLYRDGGSFSHHPARAQPIPAPAWVLDPHPDSADHLEPD